MAGEKPRSAYTFAMGAKSMGSYAPTIGLAPYLPKSRPVKVEEPPAPKVKRVGPATNPRTIKAGNYSNRWPGMSIGRKVNMKEVGPNWRQFVETHLPPRLHGKGRAVPLSAWMLVYYTPDQMQDMFAEHYPKLSREGKDSRLRNEAQEVIKEVNKAIGAIATRKVAADDVKYHQNPMLWQRILDPDNCELEQIDHNSGFATEDLVNNMWLPARFKVGKQEGYGPYGIGIPFPDEDSVLAQEASEIDVIMQSFGFDTVEARRKRRFSVLVAETSPLPEARLGIDLPGHDFNLPLQSPRAYTNIK